MPAEYLRNKNLNFQYALSQPLYKLSQCGDFTRGTRALARYIKVLAIIKSVLAGNFSTRPADRLLVREDTNQGEEAYLNYSLMK